MAYGRGIPFSVSLLKHAKQESCFHKTKNTKTYEDRDVKLHERRSEQFWQHFSQRCKHLQKKNLENAV